MARPSTLNFEASRLLDGAAGQFRNLNPNEPGQWPTLPKAAAWVGAVVLAVVLGWFLLIKSAAEELEAARALEPKLQADYVSRLRQAVNLNELRKQKLQVQEYVTQLEKQLPGKAEMDALLSDINQAGLGRGLQFEQGHAQANKARSLHLRAPFFGAAEARCSAISVLSR